ncbi:MAG: hypothetical protein KBB91_02555 [Candidatus Pacebacteria bacterium]|nr:hypothetical protein [Candidatus Paceibacterota bacterium]
MGKKPEPKDLYAAANKLLAQAGFSFDGSRKKDFSRKQKFFERRTVIMTPMGNGSR